MCAGFGFDFDNDGIMSWEDDYFGEHIPEDPFGKKESSINDPYLDDVYLGQEHGVAV